MCLGTIGVIASTWDEGGVPMGRVGNEAVCLMYTPDATVEDIVLIHLGYSVEILGEELAAQAMELRSDMSAAGSRKEN